MGGRFRPTLTMFELTEEETEDLRTKFPTANISTMSRYNPHVFTEQGLYMLMTVLKGELATKQSKALVRTFKIMKDCIIENKGLIGQREVMQLSMQTADNTIGIHKLRMDLGSVEKQMSDVMEQLGDVVTKSELAEMMNGFVSDEDNGWLMYNTKYCSADVAYSSIYSQAKKSVYLIDNYIGLRTLVLLKNAPDGVDIKIFSDNIGSGKLHNVEYTDFCREYPNIKLTMQHTGGVYHDRFIVLDYGTKDERVFLCGASSRDAGARITSIVEDFGIDKYNPLVKRLLKNGTLQLP
ncbi:MAG: ORF6N domain-containing protein [Lachnospiraceae bacterium]|nr:ORF6N domain-containing protein [Lachnospiraceae bacterium]